MKMPASERVGGGPREAGGVQAKPCGRGGIPRASTSSGSAAVMSSSDSDGSITSFGLLCFVCCSLALAAAEIEVKIRAKERNLSELAFLVREVRDLLSGNREFLLRKTNRDQNLAAHVLANKARCEVISKVWVGSECDALSQIVMNDYIPE
ncbi:Os03g0669750 [Oryza sativa Japonica Group]|uniref:Os03g0669750 protein n=2 Tax=Oryza TaxID=4527 RepID=A0A0P0W1A7_ORYSJ|nr:Os03g0669750 [Oryza sativa Japonica Group]